MTQFSLVYDFKDHWHQYKVPIYLLSFVLLIALPLSIRSQKQIHELWYYPGPDVADVQEPVTELMVASTLGHYDKVAQLIADATPLNTQGPKTGFTALHYAVAALKEEVALLLIRSGAALNKYDKEGKLPSTLAHERQLTRISQAIIERQKECWILPTQQGQEAITELMRTVIQNDSLQLQKLIDSGVPLNTQTPITKNTALHYALIFNHERAAISLINADANVMLTNNEGQHPLILAQNNKLTKTETLISKRIAELYKTSHTSLMISAALGDLPQLRLLIADTISNHKININTQSPITGSTALLYALNPYRKEIIKLLIKNGADLEVTNHEKLSALDIILKEQLHDIIEVIKEEYPGLIDELLLRAIKNNRIDRIKALLNNGANPETVNAGGFSAVQLAIELESIEVLEELLSADQKQNKNKLLDL